MTINRKVVSTTAPVDMGDGGVIYPIHRLSDGSIGVKVVGEIPGESIRPQALTKKHSSRDLLFHHIRDHYPNMVRAYGHEPICIVAIEVIKHLQSCIGSTSDGSACQPNLNVVTNDYNDPARKRR